MLMIFNIYLNDSNQKYKTAYFASGCFWCVESIYENLKGVKEVNSGYSGGKTTNPTYRQVMSGRTGHAEAIEVIYNPSEITFKTLVNVFFGSHDPTTLNKQGPDRGWKSCYFFSHYLKKNHKIDAELIEGMSRINKIDYWTVRLEGDDIDIHAKAVDIEPDFIDKPDMVWSLKQFEKDNF
jgi:peptide-methionine (S)-S-oxide reductase